MLTEDIAVNVYFLIPSVAGIFITGLIKLL